MRSYYDILEVSPSASDEVIRGAYKYLVQKWHPDKNGELTREVHRAEEFPHSFDR